MLNLNKNRTLLYTITLFIISILAFQPGLMSSDSIYQYKQALSVSFTDHHPAMMSIWWAVLLTIHKSPIVLLIFHLSMLWIALGLFARKYKNNYILLIGLLPFVINFSAVLWKDVGLAYSWFLALAILLCLEGSTKNRIFFLLLLFYGAAVRPNALAAILPILMYFFIYKCKFRLIVSGFFSLVTVAIFILVNNFITYDVLDTTKMQAGPKIIMAHDLSGISKITNHNYFPTDINELYDVEKIILRYDPATIQSVFSGPRPNFSYGKMEISTLFESWKTAIIANPQLYIQLRWKNFKALLRLGESEGFYLWVNPKHAKYAKLGVEYQTNILYKVVHEYVMLFERSFLFKGWFWLSLSIILTLFWKIDKLSSTLGLSSSFYILPYFFIGQSPDFRYIYLSVILVSIGVLSLLFYNYPKFPGHTKIIRTRARVISFLKDKVKAKMLKFMINRS